MEVPMTFSAQKTDVYYQRRNRSDQGSPTLRFLRFRHNGWLMEAIDILSNGDHEMKLASETWPLSVAPIDVSELEEEWEAGKMLQSTALEFNCIKSLIL